ncbi:uncharacterized protein [Apostichopus japonicus]|uniref:uncharacterized protein isoform X10 n=1 Tax=Stichopus japonicus TaxID=307972 RepID=UPI003AB89518
MLPCKIRGTDHTTTSRWKSISIMDQLRLFTCVVLLCALFVCSETKPNRRDTTCEEIRRRSTCADMGYDHTMFPNALGHESADSAEEALNVILSGLASVTGTGDQCYTLIRTFMCHSHVPMCVASSSTMLPPCREMCELLFSECGHIMQTIPQLSSLNCEMAPYSNSDITMPNCAPVSPVVEANVCCPRPFKNVGGACIKILKKARPQKSSVKSCEADGATFAKLAPRDHLIPFLQSELFDTADNMWLGISVEDGARLVWTFDGTEVAPEYLMGGGLSPDDIGSRKTCFILDAEGEIGVADCRNTDAPTLCQVSNECPFGISSTPRVVEVTPPDEGVSNGTSVTSDGEEREEDRDTPFVPLPESGECEAQTMVLCRDLGYTMTRFPNALGMPNQEDAFNELKRWAPLIGIGCSPHMKELLCSLYAPPCMSASSPAQLPCREVCESAKEGCLPQMQKFGHSWPNVINCTKFASYSGSESCYMGSLTVSDSPSGSASGTCELIEDPMCLDFGYSYTMMPNGFGQATQMEASMGMNAFQSLILLGCSPALPSFLCGMFYPVCTNGINVLPCRSLCETARSGCASFVEAIGLEWPPELDCANLQEDELCFNGTSMSEMPGESEESMTPPSDSAQTSGTCQPLRVPSCSHMPYNFTEIQDTTQEQIETLMQNYLPLIQLGCSSALTNFFCSIHAPPCTITGMPFFPCREVCEAAIDGCPILQQAPADQSVDCNLFPPRSSGMCVYVETEMDQPSGAECEPLELTACQGFGYTHTAFPNYLAQQSQSEAALFANIFDSIENTGECADVFLEYACQLLAPRCVGEPMRRVPPCRQLCERTRSACASLFDSEDLSSIIDCETLDAFGSYCEDDENIGDSCEEVTVPLCQDMPYYSTSFPNMFGLVSQEHAALEVHMYTPLVKVQCSPHLKEFLCAAYVPMCSPTMRTPCRELCQSARAGCENLMVDFGFEWPGKLACESFPSSQEDMDCYIGSLQDDSAQTSETCQPLRVPSCSHMPYNYTEMQNTTQEQIETLMQNYLPLIQLGCSSALTNFFCSIHAPPCSVNGMPSFPCREMCEAAIDGCPILQQAPADQSVDCNLFPPRSSGMCVYVETEMDQPSGAECEPLELTTCQGFGYTHTAFPNYLAQQSQSEAAFFADIFDSIENTGECADVFLEYACQLLAPRCVGEPMRRVPPCRQLCERTRTACASLFDSEDLSSIIDCETLDAFGSYCEDDENIDEPIFANVTYIATQPPSLCEPVAVSMCAELGFHFTTSQQEASATEMNGEMSNIMPLVQSMCSPLLLPLTCSAYTPRCDPLTGGVEMPCREICRDVLKDCKKVLKGIGIEAPSFLSCKRYPSNEDSACVMDIAPPLEPIIAEYTRTDTSLTISVEQPEGTYGIPGRGFSGYNIIHDMGVVSQDSDGSRTDITFDLTPEQSLHHIVVTVVPFNGFGEGRATDILTKSDMSMPRPGNLQVSPQPDEDGSYQLTNTALNTFACSNAADDVMAYPEWSRNGIKVEVESVESASYHVVRYGERTTVLIVTKVDSAIYTCSLEGESEVRRLQLKLPCEGITQPFCGYESIQLPNFYGHTSESEAISDAMAFVTLIQAQCSENLFNFVCATYTPMCDAPVPVLCRELCESAMRECSEVITATNFQWPDQASCENFPSMADGNCYSGSNPEPGAEPEPEPEVYPEPEPEMTPEPETEPMPNATDSGSSNAAQPPVVLKKRRYDISEQGVSGKFQGWADVQGQGAANDYCRVLKFRKKRFYLACALAGSDDELSYTSPDIRSGDFDEGFKDTWYMKDEDGDGRDDFCRCIDGTDTPYVSCMRAGDDGFEGHYDFTPTESVTPINCQKIRVNPFLGHPQIDN